MYSFVFPLQYNLDNCKQISGFSLNQTQPGASPTNVISIDFKIRSKSVVPWIKIYSTDHNEILHSSRQLHSSDVCKISLWSVGYVMYKSIM